MFKVAATLTSLSALAGCAAPPPAPASRPVSLRIYDPAAVAVARQEREGTVAVILWAGRCVQMSTSGQIEGEEWAPIWPRGTQLQSDKVVLPNGEPLRFGRNLSVTGRYVRADEGALLKLAQGCGGRPFLGERANRNSVWNGAAELVGNSDGALVLRIDFANFSDPRPDGFQTTLLATVMEPIKGPYRQGTTVKLRLPAGAVDRGRLAHVPLRGLYPAASGQRILLFVDQEFYEGQSRARKGTPLPGYLGGATFYRLDGEQVINDTDSPAPADLAETRRLAAGASRAARPQPRPESAPDRDRSRPQPRQAARTSLGAARASPSTG